MAIHDPVIALASTALAVLCSDHRPRDLPITRQIRDVNAHVAWVAELTPVKAGTQG